MFSKRFLFLLPLLAVTLFAPRAMAQEPAPASGTSGFAGIVQSMNPDLSAIVDMFYYHENSDEGMGHLAGEIAGFGHSHAEGGEEEHHHGADNGFNLRHLELQVSAEVDPYFKASAIAAIDLESAELEEAVMETTSLPFGLKVKGGKFFSDFGYINAQHSHSWDFTDQPLIYQLALGPHGLNDKGLQLSWLAPTPFYLMAGAEAFQGDGESPLFAYDGEEPLPVHDGPRIGVGWLKIGPNLPGNHGLQCGAFAATGKHQEAHDGDGDGEPDHWLDGDSSFLGADAVYKYNAPLPYGQGDVTVQAEYFRMKKDLDLVAHDLVPQLAGNSRIDEQDGYYVQATYGFLPRWRAGLRWEQVGLTNESELPDGTAEDFGTSDRASAMLDFTPSEFSRIRLQANQGSYETDEGREDVTEYFVQWMVSLGTHGAHQF